MDHNDHILHFTLLVNLVVVILRCCTFCSPVQGYDFQPILPVLMVLCKMLVLLLFRNSR